ncbi:MAG TPA: YEATS-associated helix-containing protein, partial [Candidatus Binatia bacterium]|nr:YEATS-associated helix-containing protein [Candidatus Binatia bacterium]
DAKPLRLDVDGAIPVTVGEPVRVDVRWNDLPDLHVNVDGAMPSPSSMQAMKVECCDCCRSRSYQGDSAGARHNDEQPNRPPQPLDPNNSNAKLAAMIVAWLLFGGAVGGWASFVLERHGLAIAPRPAGTDTQATEMARQPPSVVEQARFMIVGAVAALMVPGPLYLSSSNFLERSATSPAALVVLCSFGLIAAMIGMPFIELVLGTGRILVERLAIQMTGNADRPGTQPPAGPSQPPVSPESTSR